MTWGYPAHQRFSGRPTGSWWSQSATAVNNHLTGLKQRPRKTTWYTYDLWQISGWAVLELTRSRIINHQPSFVSRDRVGMSEIILVCQQKISGNLSEVWLRKQLVVWVSNQTGTWSLKTMARGGSSKAQTSREDVVVGPNTTASSTSLELHS